LEGRKGDGQVEREGCGKEALPKQKIYDYTTGDRDRYLNN